MKPEYVNPPPLPPMSQAAVEAEREVLNYFTQMEAAEEQMRGRFCRGEGAMHDSIVVEVPGPNALAVAMIEAKFAAIEAINLEGVDPYAACAMTEEEYVAAYNEWIETYTALKVAGEMKASVLTDVVRWNDDNEQEVDDE